MYKAESYYCNFIPKLISSKILMYHPVVRTPLYDLLEFIAKSNYYYASVVKNFNLYDLYEQGLFYCKFEQDGLYLHNYDYSGNKMPKFEQFAKEFLCKPNLINGRKFFRISSKNQIITTLDILKKIEAEDDVIITLS